MSDAHKILDNENISIDSKLSVYQRDLYLGLDTLMGLNFGTDNV